MFLYKFPSGPLETNAILVGCSKTKKAAIIDPAFQSSAAIFGKAEELGLVLEKILLTHSHWDHFADAYAIKEKLHIPLLVHRLDAKNLKYPGSDGIPLFVPIHPVEADQFLEEGDKVFVGEIGFEVIHTPGHSPGGICFYSKDNCLLIAGDTLFQGCIGNLHLPTADAKQMWPSLAKLAILPARTRVVPGHGTDTTIGDEAWLPRAEEIFSS